MNLKELATAEVRFFGSSKVKKRVFDAIVAMVKAGIDIVTALDRLAGEKHDKLEQELLTKIRRDLHDGMPLWKSFQKHKIIPRQMITLVQIGEKSGNLAQSLVTIQRQISKNNKFRGRLWSASLYPMFVLALLIIVGGVIMVFVLPQLSSLYRNLGSEPPLSTRLLISAGEFSQQYGLIAYPAFLAVLAAIFYFLFGNSKTRFIGDSLMFATPIVNKIIKEVHVARMGLLMNSLLEAGVPVREALFILEDAIDFHEYKKVFHNMAESLYEGNNFNAVFANYKNISRWIPSEAQLLIINGEQTGELSENFLSIGETFEERTETTAKNFGTLFEPFLIIIVWLGVGLVAFSVILPLYTVVGRVGDLVDPGGTINQPIPPEPIEKKKPATPDSFAEDSDSTVPDSRDELLFDDDEEFDDE